MPPIPLTVAMHWFQVEKPQFDAPPKRPPHICNLRLRLMCEENTARVVLVRAARSVLLHPELVHAGESIKILRLNLLPAIKIRQRPAGGGELRTVAQE